MKEGVCTIHKSETEIHVRACKYSVHKRYITIKTKMPCFNCLTLNIYNLSVKDEPRMISVISCAQT